MKKTLTKTKTNVKIGVGVGLVAFSLAAAAFALSLRLSPTISLIPESPAGAAIPGWGQVLIFGITPAVSPVVSTDVEIDRIIFKVTSTDNAGTGWNTCAQLGDADKWSIVGPHSSIDDDTKWVFYNSSRVPCSGTEIVAYAGNILRGPFNIALEGGTTPFFLYADTTGASTVDDDSFQISLERNPLTLTWTDALGGSHTGLSVIGLPFMGGTLIY